MGIYRQVDIAGLPQLKEWWESKTPPDWAESRDSLLEEVGYALTRQGPEGVAFLTDYAKRGDEGQRPMAVYFLGIKRFINGNILTLITDAFHQEDAGLKTSALWALVNVETYVLNRQDVEELLSSSDDRLSALAMVYLSRAYPAEAVEMLRQGLLSDNPRKREYACDEIGDRVISELREGVAQALNDPHPDVRESAKSNLEILD
jgi:hypothetical protein